jgi:hypothetical protein
VRENKKQWLELAQTAQETIKNRKNSLKMSNGNVNNNNYNYSNGNNNNGDATNESSLMSKIVGKFPLDSNGIASGHPLFIKPQNGITTTKIVNFSNWKKDGRMDQ